MVYGFAAEAGEHSSDVQVYPNKLTAFRRFRFRPRPAYSPPRGWNGEWADFADGNEPVVQMPSDVSFLSLNDPRKVKERNELYHGKPQWEPCLTATSYGHVVYTAGAHTAYCAQNFYQENAVHRAPQKGCSCGYWCYYTPDYATDIGTSTAWTCLAAVEVWGDIVPGTKGVRAEHMQIVGILPPAELLGTVYPVVKAWQEVLAGLHVPQYGGLGELLEFHPPQDVSGLIPKEPERSTVPYELTYSPGQSFLGTWNSGLSWSITHPAASYYSIPVPLYVPQYSDSCSLCSYAFTARTQADLDRLVGTHYTTVHLMPSTATAIAA
jgi:hypothetical protein